MKLAVRRSPLIALVLGGGSVSCHDESNQDSATLTVGGVCVTDAQGVWNSPTDEVIDWSDPGPTPSEPLKAPPYDDIRPHHDSTVAVHAVHLPTAELMVFHGANEERIWPIGQPASAMRWLPIPFPLADPATCSYEAGVINNCYPSIFCAGHVVLPNGHLFTAGGNVTGQAAGGGLLETFTFDPGNNSETMYPFGWTQTANMEVDRWYPTLTVLPDGRVLISSGGSRAPNGQNRFEVYTPSTDSMEEITISGTSPFTVLTPIPWYPFMFVLPNGDVFYAGGWGASDLLKNGRVLIPDYNGGWAWDEREFSSSIGGGSAVMYAPGKIMKSGGLHRGDVGFDDADNLAQAETETIDLHNYASGDYANAPNFVPSGNMNQARHFHTLTLLPDGRVLATGGNRRGTGELGDHTSNQCASPMGTQIADKVCSDVNLDGEPDSKAAASQGCAAVPSRCWIYDSPNDMDPEPGLFCRLLGPHASCDGPGNNDIQCGSECADDTECPPGSTCDATLERCKMPCPEQPSEECGAVTHCTNGGGWCDPANNQCHATKTAEIWDPSCGEWTELDTENRPRMYHSTALLLPDRTVISMGGGHQPPLLAEQESAEIFVPEYGPPGTGNSPEIVVVGETDMMEDFAPSLPYGETAMVMFVNGSEDIVADQFSLVRLGSVTHQFDMDQRFLWRGFLGVPDTDGPLMVFGPANPNDAPPGYYMLFLRTTDGEVSTGQYVKVTNGERSVYVCPATENLAAVENSCTMEPVDGECPPGGVQQNPVPLPLVNDPAGPVEGWHVLVPAGEIDYPLNPTDSELAMLDARCVAACTAHWAGDPALAGNCGDPDVFDPPLHFYDGAAGAYDLILPGQKHAEGVFPGQALACNLDSDCCSAFDEQICAAIPDRTTPANDLLGAGEEYKVALGSMSTIKVITNQGTYTSGLTGSAGYSFCRDGNVSAPCPFYLGSFEALATSAITASMTCADNTTARVRLTNLLVKLSQPAFGIAEAGTDRKGFPKGALVFESAFDVDSQHFTTRRPSTSNTVMEVSGQTFDATDLTVTLSVPCNTSSAAITVKLTVRDPGPTGSALGKPPVVTNTTSVTGGCGVSRALTATVSDPNGDAGAVRWRVDGVLMAPGTSAMIVTEAHTIEAVVRDARGATTTARKEVSCN